MSNFHIICPQSNPQADLRLFCFPYAGANSWIYRTWAKNLPKYIELFPVELPGRGKLIKLPLLTTMKSLVDAIAPAILPYLDKPFCFFGHSMGGLLSFELTRYLRQHYGKQPVRLFVSARRAPQIPPSRPPIHKLSDLEFKQQIKLLNGTRNSVLEDRELMELMLPILRADFEILETYQYVGEEPLECPITAFGGLEDPVVNIKDLEGWRSQTRNSFQLEMLSGDHFFIHSSQSILLNNTVKYLKHITNFI